MNSYWLNKDLKYLNCSSMTVFYKTFGANADIKQIVKDIQVKLHCNMLDGLAGNETITKTKQYQSKHNLVVDGIAGVKTRACLYNNSNWEFPHFKRKEFTCKCGCGFDNIDYSIVSILEDIRSHFGNKPIIVTSGCRCEKYNDSLKGSIKGSTHTKGRAVDFYIKNVSVTKVLSYCKQLVKEDKLKYTYTNNTNMKGAVHINI